MVGGHESPANSDVHQLVSIIKVHSHLVHPKIPVAQWIPSNSFLLLERGSPLKTQPAKLAALFCPWKDWLPHSGMGQNSTTSGPQVLVLGSIYQGPTSYSPFLTHSPSFPMDILRASQTLVPFFQVAPDLETEAARLLRWASEDAWGRRPGDRSRDPRSAIRDPRSAIRDPRSAIRDPRSAIRDPRSAIRDRLGLRRGPHG